MGRTHVSWLLKLDYSQTSNNKDYQGALSAKPTSNVRLLMNQFERLCSVKDLGVELVKGDISKWTVSFEGPTDSPYKGGKFDCSLVFPMDYPHAPPEVTMISFFLPVM